MAISELPHVSGSKWARCEAIDTEIIFYSHANIAQIHKKGFELSLALKMEVLELKNGLFVFHP